MNHFGFKPLLVAGFALIAGALMWLAQVEVGGGYVSSLLGPALIAGAGLGTTLVSVVTAATHDLGGKDESGLASGLVNTTNQVGGALGLAMLSTIAFARVDAAMAEAPGNPAGMAAVLAEGFRLTFYTGAKLAAGIVVALLVTTRPGETKEEEGTGVAGCPRLCALSSARPGMLW